MVNRHPKLQPAGLQTLECKIFQKREQLWKAFALGSQYLSSAEITSRRKLTEGHGEFTVAFLLYPNNNRGSERF